MKNVRALHLVLIALLVGSSAVAGAAASGYGPLAYITYHIINTNEGNITIIPTNVDLGNLTPGAKGNITVNATFTLSKTGSYTIMLLHVEKLRKAFSEFKVLITLGNRTIELNLNHPYRVLHLENGTYQVHVTIIYQVSQNPKGDLNVSNEPLLIIHPGAVHKDHHNKDHHKHDHKAKDDNGDDDENEDN